MAEVPQLNVNKNSKRRSSISHKDYAYKATRDYDEASSKKIEQGLSTPSFKDLMNTVQKKQEQYKKKYWELYPPEQRKSIKTSEKKLPKKEESEKVISNQSQRPEPTIMKDGNLPMRIISPQGSKIVVTDDNSRIIFPPQQFQQRPISSPTFANQMGPTGYQQQRRSPPSVHPQKPFSNELSKVINTQDRAKAHPTIKRDSNFTNQNTISQQQIHHHQNIPLQQAPFPNGQNYQPQLIQIEPQFHHNQQQQKMPHAQPIPLTPQQYEIMLQQQYQNLNPRVQGNIQPPAAPSQNLANCQNRRNSQVIQNQKQSRGVLAERTAQNIGEIQNRVQKKYETNVMQQKQISHSQLYHTQSITKENHYSVETSHHQNHNKQYKKLEEHKSTADKYSRFTYQGQGSEGASHQTIQQLDPEEQVVDETAAKKLGSLRSEPKAILQMPKISTTQQILDDLISRVEYQDPEITQHLSDLDELKQKNSQQSYTYLHQMDQIIAKYSPAARESEIQQKIENSESNFAQKFISTIKSAFNPQSNNQKSELPTISQAPAITESSVMPYPLNRTSRASSNKQYLSLTKNMTFDCLEDVQ